MRRINRRLTEEHRKQVESLEWVAEVLAKREFENKHVGNATDLEDLKQVAMWGICAAVYDWLPNGGKAIHSYAWDRAKAYIGHYMRDKSRIIKIPRAIQKVYYGYIELSKNPDKPINDILFELECTEEQLEEAKGVSLSTPFQLFSETLNPEFETTDDDLYKDSYKLKALAIVAKNLTDSEMNICLNYFNGKLKKASDQRLAEELISSLRNLLDEENITLDTLDE